MPALLYTHGRPGFYFRVLEEGVVGADDTIERVAAGPQAMTVREASARDRTAPADRLLGRWTRSRDSRQR